MKYTSEIIINLPRAAMIKKFDKTEDMIHWQRGLRSAETVFGIPGEVGSKSRLKYRIKNREVIMTETVIRRNLPDEFHMTYETEDIFSLQKNYFIEIDEQTTKWVSVSEFKFSGLKMNFIGKFMPDTFKKRSYKCMLDFKDFAEKNSSVSHFS